MFSNIGIWELLVILGIILLLFGGAKLPSLARSLGSSVNEFKKGMKEGKEDEPAEEKAVEEKK
jgi:sec-independent protein translocase protein TatA